MVDSLGGSGVVSCISSTIVEVRSCNIELSHVLPKGYEQTAVCEYSYDIKRDGFDRIGYQSSEKAGDAHCAFNGTGYSLEYHSTIPVPGTVLCESAHPPVTQKKAASPVKRSSEDSLDYLLENMLKLDSRSLPSGSPRVIVSAAADESSPCSNPWAPSSTVSSQEPSPTVRDSAAFLPAITTVYTPTVQHETSQSTSVDTDTTEATATLPNTPSPTMMPWDVLTVNPATSTTTVTWTSTSSLFTPVSTTVTSQAWRFSWTDDRHALEVNATKIVAFGMMYLAVIGRIRL